MVVLVLGLGVRIRMDVFCIENWGCGDIGFYGLGSE